MGWYVFYQWIRYIRGDFKIMTEVKLKDIAEIFSGVHIFRFMDETADLKPVLKNKLDENNNLEFDYENISDKIDLKYYSKKGDILISLSEPNTVYKLNHEGFIITMYFVIIRLKDNYDSSFIFHILESNSFHKKLLSSFIKHNSNKHISYYFMHF